MVGLALLFPGQASQAVGMGVALRHSNRRANAIFALSDQITGLPITRLCEEGPLERLTATEVAQPAVVTTSLAALAVLREALGSDLVPMAVAGHSVGEFAACVAAGALGDAEALQLVHVRATAMAAACQLVDGTMAAVLGLDADHLRHLCVEASVDGESVELANINAPDQLVVSGARAAVGRLTDLARGAGARRVLPLNVGGPFHSTYMQPAARTLAEAVARTTLRAPAVPLVANVTAQPLHSTDQIVTELGTQIDAPVRWVESLQSLVALGCDRFLEVGPGQVLAGLVKRTLPGLPIASFGTPADLSGAADLIRNA